MARPRRRRAPDRKIERRASQRGHRRRIRPPRRGLRCLPLRHRGDQAPRARLEERALRDRRRTAGSPAARCTARSRDPYEDPLRDSPSTGKLASPTLSPVRASPTTTWRTASRPSFYFGMIRPWWTPRRDARARQLRVPPRPARGQRRGRGHGLDRVRQRHDEQAHQGHAAHAAGAHRDHEGKRTLGADLRRDLLDQFDRPERVEILAWPGNSYKVWAKTVGDSIEAFGEADGRSINGVVNEQMVVVEFKPF